VQTILSISTLVTRMQRFQVLHKQFPDGGLFDSQLLRQQFLPNPTHLVARKVNRNLLGRLRRKKGYRAVTLITEKPAGEESYTFEERRQKCC
jgi:hypothetical protein